MPLSRFPVGKLPQSVLSRLLDTYHVLDDRVVVGPKIGEDCAVIDFGETDYASATLSVTKLKSLITKKRGHRALQHLIQDSGFLRVLRVSVAGKRQWTPSTLSCPTAQIASSAIGHSV